MGQQTLKFRGSRFAHFVGQDNEGGVFVRANMRADLTQTICDHFSWKYPDETVKKVYLLGELGAGRIILTCQQTNMNGNPEVQLDFDDCTDFWVARVKDKKDSEATRLELRFQIRSTSRAAAGAIQEYKALAKRSTGEMKMTLGKPKPGEEETKPPLLEGGKQEEAPTPRAATTSAAMGDRPRKGQPRGRGTQRQQIQDAANQEVVVKVDKEDGEDGDAAADIISRSLASGAGENAENVH